ncbi:RNA exonuclease 1 homolog [Euwallacea fornicatus]|uniref:RNA exonuclease 1 homolog n=1 Tax=Euwallacea fornicatus TaxID=995702 RepID=UPI00338F1BBC
MLPTKGYFQDIECPFYNTTCGRPYCHFRHKKRPNECVDDGVPETSRNVVPTYKPTPKSELANIHNNRSHIPISYVPDLAFKQKRTVRPIKIQKPTYKPTPLSILSSAAQSNVASTKNDQEQEAIKGIQENIANNIYDPLQSEINFEDLTNEFDLIDNIINDSEEGSPALTQLEQDIEKEQKKLNLLQSNVVKDLIIPKFSSDEEETPKEKSIIKIATKKDLEDKQEKPDSTTSENKILYKKSVETKNPTDRKSDKSRDKEKSSSSSGRRKDSKHSTDKTSKSHKSSQREKHRKEEKKNSSKERPSSKSKSGDKKHKNERYDSSDSGSKEISSEISSKDEKLSRSIKEKARERSRSRSKQKERSSRKTKSPRSQEKSASNHKSRKRSGSGERHKNKKKSKYSEDRDKDKVKEKIREKEKANSSMKKPSKDMKDEKKRQTLESDSVASQSCTNMEMDSELLPSDIDLDYEDEDETLRECYKIFSEYKPKPISPQLKLEEAPKELPIEDNMTGQGKRRTAHAGAENVISQSKFIKCLPPSKTVLLPGQILANRYKIAKMAQASKEQENIIKEVKSIMQEPKRPSSLLEAARLHKLKRLQQQKLTTESPKAPPNVVDDILNGVHRPGASQVKIPKKIAAVPNVALIEKAKERISLIKKQSLQNVKTVAHTQKGGRIAHVPDYTFEDVPDVFQADKSKLPVNVRTRFLTMMLEECSKLYAMKEDAYNRALNEEFACYEKCKVLATYRNSSMLAVNRLRKELLDRETKGLGPVLSGESALPKKESAFEGRTFYEHVKNWILSEEELDMHGYPKEGDQRGKTVISNRAAVDYSITDDNHRKCSRCGKLYQVDDDGWPLFEEECMYHPLKKRTIKGEQIFLCCKTSDDTGCVTSDTHVFDGTLSDTLEGFQTTLSPEDDSDPRSTQVYALDCEMCYTTKGLELTRVTIVDVDCKTVYESLVKPLNPIIDYNTRFSGITKEQMDRTSTSILQVQANILHLCNSATILVGHSLESDMKALKIVHGNVIDTSVLFPHKMGLPHKRALRALASEYLKKIIQNDVAGHDSAEDAIACMELIKWKLKEDLKVKVKTK